MLILIYRKLNKNAAESLHSLKAWLADHGEIVDSVETAHDVSIVWKPSPTTLVSTFISLNTSLNGLELQKCIPKPSELDSYKIDFYTVQTSYHRAIVESDHPLTEDEAQQIAEAVWLHGEDAKLPPGVKLKDVHFDQDVYVSEGPALESLGEED